MPAPTVDEPTLRSLWRSTSPRSLARENGIALGVFFVLGLVLALLMRLDMIRPGGLLVGADAYHKLFTMHGLMMVYFVLLPLFPAVLGLRRLAAMLDSDSLAFPRLARLASRFYIAGGALVLIAALTGGADVTWTFAAPYSFTSAHGAVALAAIGVLLAGLSYVGFSVVTLTSVHTRRPPGRSWSDLPLFTIGLYAGAWAMLLAAPVLCTLLVLLLAGRTLSVDIFTATLGGDPTVFNNFFWFFATPALYTVILPAAGGISTILEQGSGRPLLFRRHAAYALLAVAVLSLFLWGQHLIAADATGARAGISALLSHLMALPFGVLFIGWMVALRRGGRDLAVQSPFAIVFVLFIIVGGLTGLFLASPAVNLHVHNTLFVVAHFHFLLVGGVLTAALAILDHDGSPSPAARRATGSATVAAILLFVGVNATFGPLFLLGYQGMPRRHHTYPAEFQPLQILSAAGATILIAAIAIAILVVMHRRRDLRARAA